MSWIKDTFFGGAEKKAASAMQEKYGEAGQMYGDFRGRAENALAPYSEAGRNALTTYVDELGETRPGEALPQFSYGGDIPEFQGGAPLPEFGQGGRFDFRPQDIVNDPGYQGWRPSIAAPGPGASASRATC